MHCQPEKQRPSGRTQSVEGGLHPARQYQPSTGAVKGSKILWPRPFCTFKLIESAQARWRAVNAPHLVALVRAGAKFENGKLIERPESDDESQAA
jgi:hypothetical protein